MPVFQSQLLAAHVQQARSCDLFLIKLALGNRFVEKVDYQSYRVLKDWKLQDLHFVRINKN